jgi:hypothetical protein
MLYNTKGEVPEEEYVIPLGKADLKREGDHCSIITNGKMALVAMQAGRSAREGWHQRRCRRSAHRASDGRRGDPCLGREDQPRRRPRGRLGDLRHRDAGRGLHTARLASTRSTHRSSACTRRTFRCPTPRTSSGRRSPMLRRRSRRFGKSCTWISCHPLAASQPEDLLSLVSY